MEESKLNNLNCDVRRKTEEIQDVFRDIERWEKDIEKTDRELMNGTSGKKDNIPPIRRKSESKPKSKKVQSDIPKSQVYDYSKWDKFDTDKALDEIDSSDSDENELEIEQMKQKANMEKDQGNLLFSKGKYSEAIAAYTRGIQDDPTNAILPANRAMALLKTGQIGAAEQDCTLSISLDCTYIKAFHRRGTCRFALNKYQLARQDFLKVLEMDPLNKAAKIELDKVQEQLRLEEKAKDELSRLNKPISVSNSIETFVKSNLLGYDMGGIILPVDKAPHLRSKKPLKRIPISCGEMPQKPSKLNITTATTVIPKVAQLPSPSFTPTEPELPPTPQTAYQFETDWRKLRHWPQLQLDYLKQFPSENVTRLFKQSIETEVFNGIIRTLSTFFKGNERLALTYLQNMTQIGRFGTTVLFLLDEDKNIIKFLLDEIGKHDLCCESELANLSILYI